MNDTERLISWMAAQDMSAKEMAEKMGIRASLISMIKSGERAISLNVQVKFINTFGREEAEKVFIDSPVLAIMDSVKVLATPTT